MLEIILVYSLCSKLGKSLRAKNRSPLGFQVLLVVMWFGGEIGGGILYVIAHALSGNPVQEFDIGIYIACLVGAAAGAGSVFFFASLMTDVHEPVPDVGSPAPTFDNLQERPDQDPDNPYSSPYS